MALEIGDPLALLDLLDSLDLQASQAERSVGFNTNTLYLSQRLPLFRQPRFGVKAKPLKCIAVCVVCICIVFMPYYLWFVGAGFIMQ